MYILKIVKCTYLLASKMALITILVCTFQMETNLTFISFLTSVQENEWYNPKTRNPEPYP